MLTYVPLPQWGFFYLMQNLHEPKSLEWVKDHIYKVLARKLGH